MAIVLLVTMVSAAHAQSVSIEYSEFPPAPQAKFDAASGKPSPDAFHAEYFQAHPAFLVQPVVGSGSTADTGALGTDSAGHDSAQVDPDEDSEESDSAGYKASSYVPLDSWIYSAFDRLAALRLMPTISATVRPWTRLESARLLAEAHANLDQADEISLRVLSALDAEFAREKSVYNGERNTAAEVESTYGRYTELSGTPLRDSFHFAQSLSDDFGRPYGKGANAVSGLSARAEGYRFSVYFRGEYQYASAIPTYSAAAQQVIPSFDFGLPFGWNLRSGTTSRLHPIEAYASLNMANWQLSFGQQALWWGPDKFTSLILSNNADAMPMLRLARVKPAHLPGVLSWMGPLHFEFFFSREGGIHYVNLAPAPLPSTPAPPPPYGSASQSLNPPPYLWGTAFSIKPTANFELGFAHTTIFAGYGRPLNLKTFLHTFSIGGNGQTIDPGKRVTEFNLAYHPPGLRKSAVFYTEGMAWDDPVEGKFIGRYAMDPGIYIPKLPGLDRLDLRMEGVYTNLPKLPDEAYFYSNWHYPQGYTNYGQILGSWIGRQGDGGQLSSSYWLSPRNKASISYRKMSADKSYLKGGNLDDISASMSWMLKPEIEVSATGQIEQWKFPLLYPNGKSDFATILEVRVYPKLGVRNR